jgi:hypothetical protein
VNGIIPENLIFFQSRNKVSPTKPESSLSYLHNLVVGLYPDPSECDII